MLIILSFSYLYLLHCICCFINLYCMYFRGPHGRLALPNESPSLNKANLLTLLTYRSTVGRYRPVSYISCKQEYDSIQKDGWHVLHHLLVNVKVTKTISCPSPKGTQRWQNVDLMLIHYLDVESTLNRRCFNVVYLLGILCPCKFGKTLFDGSRDKRLLKPVSNCRHLIVANWPRTFSRVIEHSTKLAGHRTGSANVRQAAQ